MVMVPKHLQAARVGTETPQAPRNPRPRRPLETPLTRNLRWGIMVPLLATWTHNAQCILHDGQVSEAVLEGVSLD